MFALFLFALLLLLLCFVLFCVYWFAFFMLCCLLGGFHWFVVFVPLCLFMCLLVVPVRCSSVSCFCACCLLVLFGVLFLARFVLLLCCFSALCFLFIVVLTFGSG